MGSIIHGKSHEAMRHFRKNPAALAVYWIYLSRLNIENVAWPSLRGLAKSTGYSTTSVHAARKWLVDHGAIERVTDYVKPAWRKLPESELKQWRAFDKSEYYRPTGVLVVNGETFNLLYIPQNEVSDIEQEHVDVSPHGTSMACDVTPDDTELDSSSTELGISKDSSSPKSGDAPHQENPEISSDATDPAPEVRDEPLWKDDEYHALVADAFVVSGFPFARKIAQVLAADYRKRDAWKDAEPSPHVGLEELRAFVKWFKSQREERYRSMTDPVKINNAIAEYRAHAAKQAAAAERAAAQRERARVEEEAFTPMTEEERRAVEARYADEMRRLGRSVDMTGVRA